MFRKIMLLTVTLVLMASVMPLSADDTPPPSTLNTYTGVLNANGPLPIERVSVGVYVDEVNRTYILDWYLLGPFGEDPFALVIPLGDATFEAAGYAFPRTDFVPPSALPVEDFDPCRYMNVGLDVPRGALPMYAGPDTISTLAADELPAWLADNGFENAATLASIQPLIDAGGNVAVALLQNSSIPGGYVERAVSMETYALPLPDDGALTIPVLHLRPALDGDTLRLAISVDAPTGYAPQTMPFEPILDTPIASHALLQPWGPRVRAGRDDFYTFAYANATPNRMHLATVLQTADSARTSSRWWAKFELQEWGSDIVMVPNDDVPNMLDARTAGKRPADFLAV